MSDVRSNAELTSATAAGLRWISVARLATEILLVLSMVALARLIPPKAFGIFAIALIVQELAVNVPSEGVAAPLVQRDSIDRDHLQGGFALCLVVGLALMLLGLLLSMVLVVPLFGHETAVLVAATTPWFLLGAVLALPMAVMRRRLDFRRLSILTLAQSGVRCVASVILAAAFGLDAWALVLGGLAGMIAIVTMAVAFVGVPLPRWRTQAIRDLLPYGLPASLACFCWVGFRNGDYAIVGARLGATQAGYYWRGFQLAVEYQTKISSVMTQMAFPVLARTEGADEMHELRRRMVQLLALVTFPLLSLLVLLAPILIPWAFGADWEPAVLPTQILAGAGAATVLIDAVGSVLMASGRARALLSYGVAHFAVYIAAVLVGSRYGIAGVSVAAVLSHAAFLVVAYKVLANGRGESALGLLWGDVSAATVGCLALAATAWPLHVALNEAAAPAFIHLACVSAVGAAAYAVALRVYAPPAFRDLASLFRRLLRVPAGRAAARSVPVAASRSS
ncbi:MAG TPA: oligosaccharide flippase family protein [Thermoleophilaceae bacterium]